MEGGFGLAHAYTGRGFDVPADVLRMMQGRLAPPRPTRAQRMKELGLHESAAGAPPMTLPEMAGVNRALQRQRAESRPPGWEPSASGQLPSGYEFNMRGRGVQFGGGTMNPEQLASMQEFKGQARAGVEAQGAASAATQAAQVADESRIRGASGYVKAIRYGQNLGSQPQPTTVQQRVAREGVPSPQQEQMRGMDRVLEQVGGIPPNYPPTERGLQQAGAMGQFAPSGMLAPPPQPVQPVYQQTPQGGAVLSPEGQMAVNREMRGAFQSTRPGEYTPEAEAMMTPAARAAAVQYRAMPQTIEPSPEKAELGRQMKAGPIPFPVRTPTVPAPSYITPEATATGPFAYGQAPPGAQTVQEAMQAATTYRGLAKPEGGLPGTGPTEAEKAETAFRTAQAAETNARAQAIGQQTTSAASPGRQLVMDASVKSIPAPDNMVAFGVGAGGLPTQNQATLAGVQAALGAAQTPDEKRTVAAQIMALPWYQEAVRQLSSLETDISTWDWRDNVKYAYGVETARQIANSLRQIVAAVQGSAST